MSAERYKDATREQLLAVVEAADLLWQTWSAAEMVDTDNADEMASWTETNQQAGSTLGQALMQCPGAAAHLQGVSGAAFADALDRDLTEQMDAGYAAAMRPAEGEPSRPFKASHSFCIGNTPTQEVCAVCGAPADIAVQAISIVEGVGSQVKTFLCNRHNEEARADWLKRQPQASRLEVEQQSQGIVVKQPLPVDEVQIVKPQEVQIKGHTFAVEPDSVISVEDSIAPHKFRKTRDVIETNVEAEMISAADDDLEIDPANIVEHACPKCGAPGAVAFEDNGIRHWECSSCEAEWTQILT